MIVLAPSITVVEEVMAIEENKECRMTPIIKFLKDGTCEEAEEASMKRKCARYTLIGDEL